MNPSYRSPFRPMLPLMAGLLLAVASTPAVRADEIMRQVQEELRKRNLYFGDVDGRYTAQIAAALRRYQQRKGFQASGSADETTLRSLSLLPVSTAEATPPAVNGEPTAPDPVAVATTTLPPGTSAPWPDLPVLRSDQARINPPPAGVAVENIDPTPTPSLKPPPAAANQRWPGESVVRSFVSDYLRTGESNAPGVQDEYYASRVDYFNEGTVDRPFIAKDTKRYNKRWPERHFTLVDPVELAEAPDHDPDKVVVNFHCRFAVRQPGHPAKGDPEKNAQGETTNVYILQRTGPDSLRIVAIKEERVRGK